MTLSGFSDDIEGTSRPQGSAWDIGAYEYEETERRAITIISENENEKIFPFINSIIPLCAFLQFGYR